MNNSHYKGVSTFRAAREPHLEHHIYSEERLSLIFYLLASGVSQRRGNSEPHASAFTVTSFSIGIVSTFVGYRLR